jgi:hypothetical protein
VLVDDPLHLHPDLRDLLQARGVYLIGRGGDRGEVTHRCRIAGCTVGIGADGDRFAGAGLIGLLEKPRVALHRWRRLSLEHLAQLGGELRIGGALARAQQSAVFGEQRPTFPDHGGHVELRCAVAQRQAFAQICGLGVHVLRQPRQAIQRLPALVVRIHRLDFEQHRYGRVPTRHAAHRPQLGTTHAPCGRSDQRISQDAVAQPVATADFGRGSECVQLRQPRILPRLPGRQRPERVVGESIVAGARKGEVGPGLGMAFQVRLQKFVGDGFYAALGFRGSDAAADRRTGGC